MKSPQFNVKFCLVSCSSPGNKNLHLPTKSVLYTHYFVNHEYSFYISEFCENRGVPCSSPADWVGVSTILHSTGIFACSAQNPYKPHNNWERKKQYRLYLYCSNFLVEMTGVEPVSENIFTPASTSVDCVIRFPSRVPHNHVPRYGSF